MEKLALLEQLFWIVALVAAAIGIYYLYKWLKGLYEDFTASGGDVEKAITNMFTPHNDDGTVNPSDVAPKGTDPVDWLFMQHPDAT